MDHSDPLQALNTLAKLGAVMLTCTSTKCWNSGRQEGDWVLTMRPTVSKSFDDYVSSAHQNARDALVADCAAIEGFRVFHKFMSVTLWADGVDNEPTAPLLIMNSHMLFLAGAHTAMQGHAAAVFPALRTALESACYAFLISRSSVLQAVWTNRHNDAAAQRACRRAFSEAIPKTVDAINFLQAGSADIVQQLYSGAIDYGAHPNVLGVFSHLSFKASDTDEGVAVSLTALHGVNDFETQRALIGSLDFAFGIALVAARSRPKLTRELVDSLDLIDAAKRKAINEFGLIVG